MFRASSAHLQEDTVVYITAYGTVTPYESSWWLVGIHTHSSCVPTGHQELSYRVTVPYAACIQLYPPEDEHLRLEHVQENSIL